MSNAHTKTQVLIVDDDDSIRETLRFALEEEGYRVTEARAGHEALEKLLSGGPRYVVLLDQVLGDIDGVSVLRELATHRETASRHAYLLVTASAAVESLEQDLQGLSISPVTIIRKPFDIEMLFAAVGEAGERLEVGA